MHYVNYGQEPSSLSAIVKYGSSGQPVWEPTGREYSNFMWDLSQKAFYICAYCERECTEQNNEVDHFRPRKHFPAFTFDWQNLLYVCSRCNDKKGNQFPGKTDSQQSDSLLQWEASKLGRLYHKATEYINPRDSVKKAQSYFAFDASGSGDIRPENSLNDEDWSKARRTIADLDLNPIGGSRRDQLCLLRQELLFMAFVAFQGMGQARLKQYSSRREPFSSIVRYAINNSWLEDPPPKLRERFQEGLAKMQDSLSQEE